MRTVGDIKSDMEAFANIPDSVEKAESQWNANALWIELAYILAERAGVSVEAIMEIEAAWDKVDRWYA